MPISKLRAKAFATSYVQEGFVGTKAFQRVSPTASRAYAASKASRYLQHPVIQRALRDVMQDEGFSSEFITKILHRNASQRKNISASNQAVDIALRVRGEYAPERSEIASINIDISTPEAISAILKDVQEQLKQLDAISNDISSYTK